MNQKLKVKKFQESLLNSWPAKHYYFLNGWILRFTDGVTSRANSVLPINYTGSSKTCEKDIGIVEKAYKTFNLPSIFMMHDFYEPAELDDILKARGYIQYGPTTNVMSIPIEEMVFKSINKKISYNLYNERVSQFSEFHGKFSKRSIENQKVLEAIASKIKIPQKIFILAKYQGNAVGALMSVIDALGHLSLTGLLVNPEFRRERIATSMIYKLIEDWAKIKGAKIVWLSVESDNNAAINLYNKLGLNKIFSYYYLIKNLSEL